MSIISGASVLTSILSVASHIIYNASEISNIFDTFDTSSHSDDSDDSNASDASHASDSPNDPSNAASNAASNILDVPSMYHLSFILSNYYILFLLDINK